MRNTPLNTDGTRRTFLKQASSLVGLAFVPMDLLAEKGTATPASLVPQGEHPVGLVDVTLDVNGAARTLRIEPRVTLLDALRERLDLPGTKKGCDQGACGACTVLLDGQRVISCLTLAVMAQGKKITTIEGLANGDKLHPMQEAFVECDGLQCGYCTAGQIMSAIGCVHEGHTRTDEELREFMSGNLCRCGAYPNIRDAIKKGAAAMSKGDAS